MKQMVLDAIEKNNLAADSSRPSPEASDTFKPPEFHVQIVTRPEYEGVPEEPDDPIKITTSFN